jgi:hypothetical protein
VSRYTEVNLCSFHHPGSLTFSIVGPRPCRSHITLDNPRERYDRPVGLNSSPVPAGAEWDELGALRRAARSRQSAGTTEPGSWAGQSASISILVITR